MTFQPIVQATAYEVSLLPIGHIDRSLFALTVEARGRGLWAVCFMGRCLAADGTWDHEPIPSERDEGWLAVHRFDLSTALALAEQHSREVRVNGYHVLDVCREARSEEQP